MCTNEETLIGDENGGYNSGDPNPKEIKTNNIIAISKDIELLTNIFKKNVLKIRLNG